MNADKAAQQFFASQKYTMEGVIAFLQATAAGREDVRILVNLQKQIHVCICAYF
jgi:hypothetical protein